MRTPQTNGSTWTRRHSFFFLFAIALAIIGATLKSYWIEAIVDQGQPVQSSVIWSTLAWLGEQAPKAHAYDAYAKTARDFRILDALRVSIGVDLLSIAVCLALLPPVVCYRLPRAHLRQIIHTNEAFERKKWRYPIYLTVIVFATGFVLWALLFGDELSNKIKPVSTKYSFLTNYPLFLNPDCVLIDSFLFCCFVISCWTVILAARIIYTRHKTIHKCFSRENC